MDLVETNHMGGLQSIRFLCHTCSYMVKSFTMEQTRFRELLSNIILNILVVLFVDANLVAT